MPDMRSVARELRLRAERGATHGELEAQLLAARTLSRLERTMLEAYIWALGRAGVRAPKGGGEEGN
jgi:hypothetical protein